jgi:signal transduction protein with GAF and PtsI domain
MMEFKELLAQAVAMKDGESPPPPLSLAAPANEARGQATPSDAMAAVIKNAVAAVYSRGQHSGEVLARGCKIPCVSSCPNATDIIKTGQVVVVDGSRGEVYDASLLAKS